MKTSVPNKTRQNGPESKQGFIAEAMLQLLALGVNGVAEAVAEEVEGEDGDEDGAAGGEEPWKIAEIFGVLGGVEHDAPTGVGFLDADVEKAEDDFAQDVIGNAERGGDDDVRKGVG